MKTITFCLLVTTTALSACCPTRHLTTSTSDSTRIEIRHRTEYIRDTVTIEIPAQSERQTTLTDSSHLENDYAASDARINGDGSLFHSLATKAQRKPVPVDRPVEYRDSIVYRDKAVEKTTTLEVPRPLSWWQQAQMKGFWLLLAVAVVLLARKLWPVVRRWVL